MAGEDPGGHPMTLKRETRVPHAFEWTREGSGSLCRKTCRGGTFMPDGQLDIGLHLSASNQIAGHADSQGDPRRLRATFSSISVAFEVTEAEDGEDCYTATLSFRPQGVGLLLPFPLIFPPLL